MKKILVIVLAFMLVLGFSGTAFADTDSNHFVNVTITPTSDEANRIELEEGQTLLLTATAALGNASYTFKGDLWAGAAKQSGPSLEDSRNGSQGETFVSTALFTASDLGPTQVTYWIKVWRSAGGPDGTDYYDTDEAYILVVEEHTVIIDVVCKAAPAIAAEILKEAGIAHRYVIDTEVQKNGRVREIYSNYISDVAHKMGSSCGDESGSWFMGVNKCDGDGNPNPVYRQKVYDYLESLGAFDNL